MSSVKWEGSRAQLLFWLDKNAGVCSYSQFLEKDEKNTCVQFFIRYPQLCPLFIFLA